MESLQRAGEEESGAPALPTTPQTPFGLSWLSRTCPSLSLFFSLFFPHSQRFFLFPDGDPLLPGWFILMKRCGAASPICVIAQQSKAGGDVLLNVPICLFKFPAMKIFLYFCPRIIKNATGLESGMFGLKFARFWLLLVNTFANCTAKMNPKQGWSASRAFSHRLYRTL